MTTLLTPPAVRPALPTTIGPQEVCNLTGWKSRGLRRAIAVGTFPPPIRLGHRTIRWRLDVVMSWLAEKERESVPGQVA
jgi:predicted DNA-binding transcriptional regulator AlpA